MAVKTNAVRIVEHAGIPCSEGFYEFDEHDLKGTHAAHALGLPEEQVFKTLVARGERTGIHVFCIPVCCELDLKKAAKAAGDKSMELVAVKELLSLTGYIRGGCSPVGMKKKYPPIWMKPPSSLIASPYPPASVGTKCWCLPMHWPPLLALNIMI